MKMQKIIGIISAVVLAAGISHAASTKKENKAKTKEMPKVTETTLKKVEGQVKWTGYGIGKSHAGTINIKSGEIKLKNNVITSALFILDMDSLNTPDSDKLKSHLKSEDFFEVEKYKEATFKTTKIEAQTNADSKTGVTNYALTGDLTIKDKTEPITFIATVIQDGKKFAATAHAEISDRTKYGIIYHSKQFETASKLGDKLIEDNIKIDIEAKAR